MAIASTTTADLAQDCAASLATIAATAPRVHCITNAVAQTYTANMLLALGAVPSMSLALSEIADFTASAEALLINIGTLDDSRRQATERALAVAVAKAKPWVLDPVLVDRAPARKDYALELLQQQPTVVRANAVECSALAPPTHDPSRSLATRFRCVVAQTGSSDRIVDADRQFEFAGGHPLMARVTAMGCAISAVVAAFCAVESDPLKATAQALLAVGAAGAKAGSSAAGPGAFQIAMLDSVYGLDAATLHQWTRSA